MKSFVRLVDSATQAVNVIKELHASGFSKEDIYVLAHDSGRTHQVADTARANEIGLAEEGVFDSLANLFRSRGDELRSKIRSMGLTDAEAERYEEELDRGKILIFAKTSIPATL